MKKTILYSLLALLLSSGIASAHVTSDPEHASTSDHVEVSASTTAPGPLEKLRAAKAEVKDEIKGIKESLASTTLRSRIEIKNNTKARAEERIENRYEKMIVRLQATIDRETSIMAKINARAAKIKANGGNTTEAEKFTLEAKVHLDEASVALANLKTLASVQAAAENSSTTAKTLRDGLTAMRKAGGIVITSLRDAHGSLVKSVRSLRGIRLNVSATTTTSTN